MRLQKANLLALLLSLFLPIFLGCFFYSYPFFSTDRGEMREKLFKEKEKIQQEVFHRGEGVEKDLWVMDEGKPLKFHIESPSCEMRMEKTGSSYEIIETLSPVQFRFQDKGEIRVIDARLCHISYQKGTIEAFDLSMHPYETLDPKKGEAEYLFSLKEGSFSLSKENTYSFKGENLLAHFSSGYSVSCNGPLSFDPKTMDLIAEKGDQPIHFQDGPLSVTSLCLLIEYKGDKPHKISFTKGVRLQKKEMYGTADQIDYFPQEARVELLSLPESRVLFYNQNEDKKIKATRVIIEKDPLTHEDSVRGIGKVEFFLEEKDFLTLFTQIEKWTNNLY